MKRYIQMRGNMFKLEQMGVNTCDCCKRTFKEDEKETKTGEKFYEVRLTAKIESL